MTVHTWSVFEKITRYLKSMEIDNKKRILQEHLVQWQLQLGKECIVKN